MMDAIGVCVGGKLCAIAYEWNEAEAIAAQIREQYLRRRVVLRHI